MQIFTRKVVLIPIIVIAFLGILYGFRSGFPGERSIIIRNARRHIIETYGLTPTDVRVTTLYLWFPVTVRVETGENDFWFELRTGRFFYGRRHFTDDYIDQLAMNILTRELRAYVENITDGQGSVWASFGGGILPELRRDDVNIVDNPNSVFEILRGRYRLGMWFYSDIYNIDYDLIYGIYSRVFELGLEPSWISFSFGGIDEMGFRESHLRITIDYGNPHPSRIVFSEINSVDDLRQLFEEEIQRRQNQN